MNQFEEVRRALDRCGPRGLAEILVARLLGSRPASKAQILERVTGARTLEIGGPSGWFRASGPTPVYDRASSVDNVNYAGATMWESGLVHGGEFAPEGARIGTQWLLEASDLGGLEAYDVIISSHTIEHVADPLSCLREWRRVTTLGGTLLLVLPHRDGTFDHRRPVTPLGHLQEDAIAGMPESDETHVAEIIEMHDIERDPGLESVGQLRERVRDNFRMRTMHHHVCDIAAALDMVVESGWVPVAAEGMWPHDIVILAQAKAAPGQLGRIRSPFPSDRNR